MKKLMTLVVAAVGISAFAAEITWIGSETNCEWQVASNWQGGVVPGAADTAVFDPGAGVTTNVTLNAVKDICGVKLLSGTMALGIQGVEKKYLKMNADADGRSDVYVAEGAYLTVNCGMLPAEPNKTVFKKSGAGTIGFHGPLGDANGWMGGGRQGFGQCDFAGGTVKTRKAGNIFYITNAIMRTGATWQFNDYNTMLNSAPYLYLEKGATLQPYNAQDKFRGVEGYGLLRNGCGSGACTITLAGGPYRFDGTLGTTTGSSGGFGLTFGAQGKKSDEEYQFIVGNTNVIGGLSVITYEAESSPRAVTNCPIKFAVGIGQFNFYVLNCKKDAPLVLEDVDGEPVDVYAQNLGDNNKSYLNSQYFAVTGKGNFYVRHYPGSSRRWDIPFTNDCFTSTGKVGSYSDGVATFGDGKEGHDADLSTVSAVVAKGADSQVVFNNKGAQTVPALEINGTLTQKAGTGDLTVTGAASGSGTYTLTSPTTFDGPVTVTGTVNANTNVTFNGPVSGGTYAIKAETEFNGTVENGTFTISKPTTFADDVTGSTFTINATTAFEGYVRNGTFTVNSPVDFGGQLELSSAFTANAATRIDRLVTSADHVIWFTQTTNLLVGADGKDAWVSSFATKSPSAGELVLTNGDFHSAYAQDSYTALDIWRPGTMTISHPKVRLVDASALVNCYSSGFNNLTLGPGGIFYQWDSKSGTTGTITLDGGEYSLYLRQSYGHDWLVRADFTGGWVVKVAERGGRLSDYTWRSRNGNTVPRPEIRVSFGSAAAEGNVPGELTLSFCNRAYLYHKISTGGRIFLESGYLTPSEESVVGVDYSDGTFFGTNDLVLGCCTLNFGEQAEGDREPAFAANGQKVLLKAPALLCGRCSFKRSNTQYLGTAQTFTFGDGVSNPFAREKGGCLVISDSKSGTAHLDGNGVKAYVKGAKLPVDADTGIIRDPIFGAAFYEGGSGADFYRYDFLTQDADGLLKYDESVYTEGVAGGANSVARISTANMTLAEDAQVAALNLDGRALTIAEGATLKVGKDSTEYPAAVLSHTTEGWSTAAKFGSVYGKGTLDFGKSEGLILAGRSTRDSASCGILCRITGKGGLSLCGVSDCGSYDSAFRIGGDNDYAGETHVGGTDVRLESAGAFSTGAVHVAFGRYNGGRVRFNCAATYANEWFVGGDGPLLFSGVELSPGCLVFNADATLTGPVHVERFARFSTSPATILMKMDYSPFVSGTGVFAGEISGGEVQIMGGHPSGRVKKPIVFTHHNSYTGGTRIAVQDLILRGDGDCGTGKVTMSNGSVLTFENTADKTFPNMIEGKGWVKLAGSAPVHFTGGVKRESWCDVKLDLADTNPVFTEAPAFGTVTNTAAATARMTLQGSMTLDPAGYDWFDPNVRVKVDGGTVDLCGGTLSVERVELRNGGKFVNGKVVQSNPAKGLVIIFR